MVNRFSGRHTAPVTNKQLVSQTRNQETGNRVGRSSAHSSFGAACIGSVSKSRRACKFGASQLYSRYLPVQFLAYCWSWKRKYSYLPSWLVYSWSLCSKSVTQRLVKFVSWNELKQESGIANKAIKRKWCMIGRGFIKHLYHQWSLFQFVIWWE